MRIPWLRWCAVLATSLSIGVPGSAHGDQPLVIDSSTVGAPASGRTHELYLPASAGRSPGIVILHGCAGVTASQRDWGELLKDHGYVALLIDSFTARGLERCATGAHLSFRARVLDAQSGVAYLRTLPEVDPDRIAAIGFSHGAGSLVSVAGSRANAGPMPFAAIVAFYPSCPDRATPLASPVSIVIGDEDTETPASRCRHYVGQFGQGELRPELKVYRGARHGFDNEGTATFDQEASAHARDLSLRFLDLHLKAPRAAALPAASAPVEILVRPSDTDARITSANDPHYVLFDPALASPRLLLFLPGTGAPEPHRTRYLETAVEQGYRAISVSYINEPAVSQACIGTGDSDCSEKFRQKRLFGDDVTPLIGDTPADSIVNRVTKLLQYLAAHDAANGWDQFLRGESPDWSRIAVSGQSQGGGMAAFLAKKYKVARVIMFSGGWDNRGEPAPVRPQDIAVWYGAPSATPPASWFAAYHVREPHAAVIAKTYQTLAIPGENIVVFTDRIDPARAHGFGVNDPANEASWRMLLGRP